MAKNIDVDSAVFEKGFLQVTGKIGTGEKSMAVRMAFKLDEHPNLAALVPLINGEIANSVRGAFGAKAKPENDA